MTYHLPKESQSPLPPPYAAAAADSESSQGLPSDLEKRITSTNQVCTGIDILAHMLTVQSLDRGIVLVAVKPYSSG